MKITREAMKWPQIDAAFRYIYDNPDKYVGYCGAIYEFGVYKCGSLQKICNYIKDNDCFYPANIYGYDKWEGLPEETAGVNVFEKFHTGAYKTKVPHLYKLRNALDYQYIYLINKWFKDLDDTDHDYEKALIVHVDCDIFQSTIEALDWMIQNDLIIKKTLIAYDEFISTDDPLAGGESKAHYSIMEKYNILSKEIWHNLYKDKSTGQEIRQSVWEILSV